MARLPRIVVPGHPHLVIHRGRSGERVFRDAADRDLYRASLLEAARSAKVAVHAYGLLPTEVRLLVTPESEAGLANLMQAIGRRYVRGFNQKYGCTGTPWEGRFRSAVIEAATQFLPCLRFVEDAGPARADVDADPTIDGCASAAHHLGLHVDPLVSEHMVFWALGNTPFEREAAYRRLIAQPLAQSEVATILHAALNGWALGSLAFATMVGDQAGRRPLRSARGRPRKPVALLRQLV